MADAFDVGAYIIEALGPPMSSRKLQKLVYYVQAWSMAIRGRPIFVDRIEAWREGPVVPRVYETHPGMKMLDRLSRGSAAALTSDERDIVEAVLAIYADEDDESLIDKTHRERPWRQARGNIPESARSNEEITLESMSKFYSRSRERRVIDAALEKLGNAKFMELRGTRHRNAPSAEMLEYARKALSDRSRLPEEDAKTWARKMTAKLAGADD